MTDIVNVPKIDILSPAPTPTQDPPDFDDAMFRLLDEMVSMVPQINASNASSRTNAIAAGERATAANNSYLAANASAQQAANSASQAASSAGAVMWVSGTNYTVGKVVISPTTMQTYRTRTAGVSTVDPVNDSSRWEPTTASIALMQAIALSF